MSELRLVLLRGHIWQKKIHSPLAKDQSKLKREHVTRTCRWPDTRARQCAAGGTGACALVRACDRERACRQTRRRGWTIVPTLAFSFGSHHADEVPSSPVVYSYDHAEDGSGRSIMVRISPPRPSVRQVGPTHFRVTQPLDPVSIESNKVRLRISRKFWDFQLCSYK